MIANLKIILFAGIITLLFSCNENDKVSIANYCCPVKNKQASKFMMNAAFDGCKKHISYKQALM